MKLGHMVSPWEIFPDPKKSCGNRRASTNYYCLSITELPEASVLLPPVRRGHCQGRKTVARLAKSQRFFPIGRRLRKRS